MQGCGVKHIFNEVKQSCDKLWRNQCHGCYKESGDLKSNVVKDLGFRVP